MGQAVEQVSIFRKNFAAHKYVEIYNQSSDEFKKSIKEYEFIKFMDNASKKLGIFESTSIQKKTIMQWLIIEKPRIELTYLSKYSKATIFESFVFIVDDNNKIGFFGYNIKGTVINDDARDKINSAKQLVTDFRNKFAAHQYVEIYRSSSKKVRVNLSENDFIKFMDGISKEFGPLDSASLINEEFIEKEKIILTYRSKYMNITIYEYIIFSIEDNKVVLESYQYSKD